RIGVHGLPAAAATIPLLPRPVLLLVDVAVVGRIDVVVLVVRRDLGIGALIHRRALVAVRHGGLAPAVVHVRAVVVVGGLVHVDARVVRRRAGAAAPHGRTGGRTHDEAGGRAPRKARPRPVGGR